SNDPRYRGPLDRDVGRLAAEIGADGEVILLGSIATDKYVDPLLAAFGERLRFPADFVGRGDMSRGGLLLRCVRAGVEVEYVPIREAVRRGPRPARLQPLPRRPAAGSSSTSGLMTKSGAKKAARPRATGRVVPMGVDTVEMRAGSRSVHLTNLRKP